MLELHVGKLQPVPKATQTQSPSMVPIRAQGPSGVPEQRVGTSPQTKRVHCPTGGVPTAPAAKAGLVMMTGAAQTIPPLTAPFLIKSRLERRCSESRPGGSTVRTAGPHVEQPITRDGSKTRADQAVLARVEDDDRR